MSLLECDQYLEYIEDSIDAEVDSFYDEYMDHDEVIRFQSISGSKRASCQFVEKIETHFHVEPKI